MGSVVLLTGATGKFGKQLTKDLVEEGQTVVLVSRSKEKISKLLNHLQISYSDNVFGFEVDLCCKESVDNLFNQLQVKKLSVTHLINNARSLETLKVEEGITSSKNFLGEFEMEVIVPYNLTMKLYRSSLHALRNVVNIGSMYGLIAPNPDLYEGSLNSSPIQYGVSKAGMHHLTRELAVRLADGKVRVNCIAFGGVKGRESNDFEKRYSRLTPARRMLSESEISGPVKFLMDDSSSAINGHVLVADGGWSIW